MLLDYCDYLPVLVGLYALGWALDAATGLAVFRVVPGLILLTVMPGYYFIRLIRLPMKGWTWYGRLALAVVTTLGLVASSLFLTKIVLTFTQKSDLTLILVLTIGLYLATKFQRQATGTIGSLVRRFPRQFNKKFLTDGLIVLIPLALFVAAALINPTVDNVDGYLDVLQRAIALQMDPVLGARALFIPYLALAHFVTGLSLLSIFKFILPGTFYISLFSLFDYARRTIHDRLLARLAYLTVLAPAVVAIESNIVRPQLILLIVTIPVLLLTVEAIKSRQTSYWLLAFWLSLVAVGFHELSLTLFFVVAMVALALVFAAWLRRDIVITWKQGALGLIAIFPYFRLFYTSTAVTRMVGWGRYIVDAVSHSHWRWWFINNYTTIDGNNLGWRGIQAFYYYLYNGLLFMIVFAIVALLVWRYRQKRLRTDAKWLLAAPVAYTAIYLTVAEILPRLGLFFLPNRAWPHLMLGLIVVFVLFVEEFQTALKPVRWLVVVLLLGTIVSGSGASLYLTRNRVGTVFPQEMSVATYIKHQTAKDAIFLSTQPNSDLVKFYGNRFFVPMTADELKGISDPAAFSDRLKSEINQLIAQNKPFVTPEESQITQYFVGTKLLRTEKKVVVPKHTVNPEFHITAQTPVYFIYSFAKLGGINGQRPYNQTVLDQGDKPFFLAFKTIDVVYRDTSAIVIRVQ